jgi:S1-C subfamily serine protease
MARIIAQQILSNGDIHRGTLGITIEDPTPAVIRDMKLAGPQAGAVITKVAPGSAGDRAGLKSGDVVTELGGVAVRNAPFLRTRIALLRIGDIAELALLRKGKAMAVRATIVERQPSAASR